MFYAIRSVNKMIVEPRTAFMYDLLMVEPPGFVCLMHWRWDDDHDVLSSVRKATRSYDRKDKGTGTHVQ